MATERFPWARTFTLGFGFFGISIIWPIFNSLVPPMLQGLGLSAGLIGFVLTWDNIINMFLQPAVGSLSDRTRSRFGRRKPWLMVGAPLAALFFVLVPFMRRSVLGIALAILGTNVGMALFRSPTVAYLGDLFEPQQRSKANGVINLMGGVAGAIALFGGGTLYKLGVPLPFIAGAAIMLGAIVIVLLKVREPIEQASAVSVRGPGLIDNLKTLFSGRDKNGLFLLLAIFAWFVGWNAMEAFFTLYTLNVLDIGAGTGAQMLTAFAGLLIIFAIPSGLLATRIGRKPTIMIGLAGMLVGLVIGFSLRNPLMLLALLAAMGAFWALININSLPMVYDLGRGSVGMYTGLYYLFSSLAAITGPILAGWLIDLTNYTVIWLFSGVFMAVAIICMSQVRVSVVKTQSATA